MRSFANPLCPKYIVHINLQNSLTIFLILFLINMQLIFLLSVVLLFLLHFSLFMF